jgi:hypothetical protein
MSNSDYLRHIATRLGYYWAYGGDRGANDDDPFHRPYIDLAILSRHPILFASDTTYYPETRFSDFYRPTSALFEAWILVGGRPHRFIDLHTHIDEPPFRWLDHPAALRTSELIRNLVTDETQPVFVGGDLNHCPPTTQEPCDGHEAPGGVYTTITDGGLVETERVAASIESRRGPGTEPCGPVSSRIDFVFYRGPYTVARQFRDCSGDKETSDHDWLLVTFRHEDVTPPTVQCESPGLAWSRDDVALVCSAQDSGTGLQRSSDESFLLRTDVPIGSETPNAATDVRQVCDRVGNCRQSGPISGIKVDKRAPAISVLDPSSRDYSSSELLTLGYTVTDEGAGVASVVPTLDGLSNIAGHGLQSGQVLDLLTELELGQHEFEIVATDGVGNAASPNSVNFKVTVTAESLVAEVDRFATSGHIKGKALPIVLKITAQIAAQGQTRGNCRFARMAYGLFIRQVRSHSPKKIAASAAAIMIRDAEYLIAHC